MYINLSYFIMSFVPGLVRLLIGCPRVVMVLYWTHHVLESFMIGQACCHIEELCPL